jgi:hypothetical protein
MKFLVYSDEDGEKSSVNSVVLTATTLRSEQSSIFTTRPSTVVQCNSPNHAFSVGGQSYRPGKSNTEALFVFPATNAEQNYRLHQPSSQPGPAGTPTGSKRMMLDFKPRQHADLGHALGTIPVRLLPRHEENLATMSSWLAACGIDGLCHGGRLCGELRARAWGRPTSTLRHIICR